MQKIYRLTLVPILFVLRVFDSLLSAPILILRSLEEVPCTMEKLYAELTFNKLQSQSADAKPRQSVKTRNDAGSFVAFLKAVNPLSCTC
jgi:hypothetical protein